VTELYFAGADIGTQGTKTAIYARDGRLMAEAFQASELRRPGPGMVEEDPERQYASVCATLRACLERSGLDSAAIAGVAIDGQMAGTIGIGADGRAVTPYDSWLDTRCAPWIAAMDREAGAAVMALTGNAPSFNQGPKLLCWKHQHPEVWRHIRAFVQPGAYAAMRLCGLGAGAAFVDDTYLHFSGFADNAARRWDAGLCQGFGIDPDKLPRILRPTDRVGEVGPEGSRLSGLRAGTPVAAGLGDSAASFLACGATGPGDCVDVAGTASIFATTTDSFAPDLAAGIMGIGRSAVAGLWHPYAYINGGGMNLSWFAGTIARGSRGPGAEAQPDVLAYDELEALALALEPRLDDPYFVPHMEGRVMPGDPGMRGAWAGLRWSHGLDRLYRSVLEGAAFEYAVYLAAIRRLFPRLRPREVRLTGGGARSRAWTITKADVLGLPMRTVTSGGAPMGAAMVAACAIQSGADAAPASLAELSRAWVGSGPVVEPRPETAGLYARRFANYQKLLAALAGFPGVLEA
jgi:xylulokinase